MTISILTLFPDLYEPFLSTSLVRRAQEQGIVSFDLVNMIHYCAPKERIDSPTFGHGAGMILRPEVVERAIEDRQAVHGRAYKIFFSPRGKQLDQDVLKELVQNVGGILADCPEKSDAQDQAHFKGHIMLIAARYEGMDARIEEYYADAVISLGDFVLMGGDIPAMVLIEGLLRLVPGVVGRQESVERDSFYGPFVDYPEYTAPVVWKGLEVPEVLRSGNHKHMEAWRQRYAVEKSVLEHFDWMREHETSSEQNELIREFIPPHYVALMHDQVLLPTGAMGTTSVTSLDIHDIARSAKTYGLQGYSIVTPLEDQQKIVRKLLDFWQEGVGITYNPHRHEALKDVAIVRSLDEVIQAITLKQGKKPIIITTSARLADHPGLITYHDQSCVWKKQRPVLLVLGTGHGLSGQVIEQSDFHLVPLSGYSEFNHLSVRSAAAVIFDRWLGTNPRLIKRA